MKLEDDWTVAGLISKVRQLAREDPGSLVAVGQLVERLDRELTYRRDKQTSRRLPPNIRETRYGYQAYSSKGGRYRSQRFPFSTPIELMRGWLEGVQEPTSATVPAAGTLAADVAAYLRAKRALECFAERERHLNEWVSIFGAAHERRTITSLEIQEQRDKWLTVGPRHVQKQINGKVKWIAVAKPLAASSVNHRLNALSNLFRVLDGSQAPNPVRDVPKAREPQGIPRGVPYPVLLEILHAMPDRGQGVKNKKRSAISLAKVRTEVLIWTGLGPKELSRITRSAIDWDAKLLRVPPRRKGAGAPGRIIPLIPHAIAALERFDQAEAYGRFNVGVVGHAWQLACAVVGRADIRLYDIRHSFISGVLSVTRDFQQTQLLAGHTDAKTTRRYAVAAILPTLARGMADFSKHVDEDLAERRRRQFQVIDNGVSK